MQKTRLASIIDGIWMCVILFLISMLIFRFYVQNLLMCSLLSIAFSIVVFLVFYRINKKRVIKRTLSQNEQKHARDCIFQLTLTDEKDQLLFIKKLIKNDFTTINIKKDYILAENSDKKELFFVNYIIPEIKRENIIRLFYNAKKEKVHKITIYHGNYNAEIKETIKMLNSIKFTLLTDDDLYDLMKQKNTFPTIIISEPKQKHPTIKEILRQVFMREKAKGYFITGAILLLASFFLPYNLYYTAFSFVCMVFAFLCLFLRRNNTLNITTH